jgi:hypothetical protein
MSREAFPMSEPSSQAGDSQQDLDADLQRRARVAALSQVASAGLIR